MTQALWDAHGFEGVKLKYLLTSAGLFHDGHRALDDCHAAIELLSRPLGDTGRTALAYVLDEAMRTTWRLRAVGAAYQHKDLLRAPRVPLEQRRRRPSQGWFIDMREEEGDDEIAALRTEVIGADWQLGLTAINALNRFSHRI